MELDIAKGVRDFPPEEKLIRNQIIGKITSAFELYGFSPLETPLLERLDVLTSKYAGGEEIVKEIFKLNDQGGRELCLRYDLTVPLARFIGMNPNLKMPFKRYQVGDVFRDGPIKLGRYRQFVQCDVDIIGSKSMLADAQLISVAEKVFSDLDIPVEIEINNRKVLDGILKLAGVKQEQSLDVILIIDKLKKIGIDGVKKELQEKKIDESIIKKLLDILSINGTNKKRLEALKKMLTEIGLEGAEGLKGIDEIEQLLSYCSYNDQSNNKNNHIIFIPSLARGLAYYTGTVYEIFAKKSAISSSLAAGGRYDKMVGNFLQNKQEYPAVGISFGIEPIIEVWKENNPKIILQKTVTKVYIIPIKTVNECIIISDKLRNAGIQTDMDINEKGISKNLDYANAYAIPYVLIIGNEELKHKKVKLKDMNSGKEEMLSVADAIKKVKL